MNLRITLSALAVTIALLQISRGDERDSRTSDLEKQPTREESGATTITVGNVVE
jgi:hypothetical protein